MAITLPENVPVRTLELDGRERPLAFTLGALRRIRARLGDQAAALSADADWIVEHLDGLLWDLLADPEDRAHLSPEGLADCLPIARLAEYVEVLAELLAESGVQTEEKEDGEEPNPRKRPRKQAVKR